MAIKLLHSQFRWILSKGKSRNKCLAGNKRLIITKTT